MDHLMDAGIYIATHAQEKDPLILGSIIARKLRLRSIDTESLLTAIYTAKYFGVDDDLKKEAEDVVSKTTWKEKLNEVLQSQY